MAGVCPTCELPFPPNGNTDSTRRYCSPYCWANRKKKAK